MPYVLKANPDVTIIISDISPTVVREWKKFLDETLDSPNLYYAAFDFCDMPFKDNSIDIISDGGGIGNCEGVKAKALKEAYRVLKPGGKLITSTGFVNKETFAALPEGVQQILAEKRPDVFEDLYEDTVLAGFTKIDSVISGCWYTDDDESTIADLARSLGVNLKFTSYIKILQQVKTSNIRKFIWYQHHVLMYEYKTNHTERVIIYENVSCMEGSRFLTLRINFWRKCNGKANQLYPNREG